MECKGDSVEKVGSRSLKKFRLDHHAVFDPQIDCGRLGLTRPRATRSPASFSKHSAYDAQRISQRGNAPLRLFFQLLILDDVVLPSLVAVVVREEAPFFRAAVSLRMAAETHKFSRRSVDACRRDIRRRRGVACRLSIFGYHRVIITWCGSPSCVSLRASQFC